MTDAEAYLRELRRALPIGYRGRLVAEVREHFASAVATEADRGVEPAEAERLTIERLGPAQALADQLLGDLRSGALGRMRRLTVALTMKRVVALGTALAAATAAGALVAARHSSPAPHAAQPAVQRPVVVRTIELARAGAAHTLVVTLRTVRTKSGLTVIAVPLGTP